MLRARSFLLGACLVVGLAGCDSAEPAADADSPIIDAGFDDVASDTSTALDSASDSTAEADAAEDVDKAALCADEFGDVLTDSFGRVDGTVLAVVGPQDSQCAWPNDDHLVLQVMMNGAAYRMVVNVESSYGDPNVRFSTLQGPLSGAGWQEGWHTDATLDYVNTLNVHADSFVPYSMDDLVAKVTDMIPLGEKVSVYATSSGGDRANSAHLVHRNKPTADGAIVLAPTSEAATYLLFAFADQSF